MRGKFIVCDGSNGAGKSSVLTHIKKRLDKNQVSYITTREPGGTDIGEQIREILLDKGNLAMCSTTELMLFAAARAQHVHEKIFPALERGIHVISDRFESATVSFQHYGRGLPKAIIDQLNNLALGEFRPDMTLVLDLDPATGLERVRQRNTGLDRLESLDMAFLERARRGYLQQAKDYPQRFRVVDASRTLAAVVETALAIIDEVIHKSQ